MSARIGARNGMNCPDEKAWFDVAARNLPDTEGAKYVQHASECDSCGKKLASAMRLFQEDLTEEEEQALTELHGRDASQQKRLAHKLSRTTSQDASLPRSLPPHILPSHIFIFRRPLSLIWIGGVLATAIILIGLVFWRGTEKDGIESVNALLNKAYTERRNIELRFSGAAFAPARLERATSSHLYRPQALLRAEDRIASAIHEGPENAAWLYEQGRAQILEGEPEAALESLTRASELLPGSVPVLIDLASAYFQKAAVGSDSGKYYGIALDKLGQAIQRDPVNAVAFFNRAIIEEKLFQWGNAIEDWKGYLKLDSSGDWADEARSHLKSCQEMLEHHGSNSNSPLLEADEFLKAFHEPLTNPLFPTLDYRIEEYFELAVSKWLLHSFEEPGTSREALGQLASVLVQKHNDPWLRDFLTETVPSDRSRTAILLLNRAIAANSDGKVSEAAGLAEKASQMFLRINSQPGTIRAQMEKIYALRLAVRSNQCIKAIGEVSPLLEHTPYHYLKSQLYLEATNCLARLGRESEALQALGLAYSAAKAGNFPSQELNVINYRASIERAQGDSTATWEDSLYGLRTFWAGTYPNKRAYPFYVKLADLSEEYQEWHLSFAFAQEAVRLIDTTSLKSFQALAHHRLAQAALMIHQDDKAREEFDRSELLFGEVESQSADETTGEIERAKLDAARGETGAALSRLEKIASRLPALESYRITSDFYVTRGHIEEIQHQNALAESDFRTARTAADHLLESVQDERERLLWDRELSAASRGLVRVLSREGRTTDALEIWEQYRASDLRGFSSSGQNSGLEHLPARASGVDVKNSTVKGFQQSLGRGVALVYVLTDEALLIWAVDEQEVLVKRVEVQKEELIAKAKHLLLLCSSPKTNLAALQDDERRLYDWLIRPIESLLLESQPIIVEPEEEFSNLPFEALLNSNDQYLIDTHPITYLPSLLYLGYFKRDSMPITAYPLVVGVSTVPSQYEQSLDPLFNIEEEIQSIVSKLPQAKPLLGSNATLDSVLQYLPHATMFHFAGHSIYEDGKLRLVLAQSGDKKPLLDFGQLDRRYFKSCQMIVLSACSTQGTPERSFHDSDNLIRVLLRARVPHIIASRWRVDSASTVQFMDLFYSHLLIDQNIANSVATTMREMRKRHAHPYYWTSFSHLGSL